MLTGNLKQRMKNGEVLNGRHIPIMTEPERMRSILDEGRFDFIATDSQHDPFNEERLFHFCRLTDEYEAEVIFRIKHTEQAYLIGNMLDLGPAGIEVPQVELESTVDTAINAFYYPQFGKRSWGGVSRPVPEHHQGRLGYSQWWKENGILWIQVESINSVTNAQKLAKSGVDCVSFGPADLSFSLECYPNHFLKTVEDCVQHVAEQLNDTGVAVCMRGVQPEDKDLYIEMGTTVFINYQ